MKTIIIDYFDVLRQRSIDVIREILSHTKLCIGAENNIKILVLDDECHLKMCGRYPIWDEDHRLRVLNKELLQGGSDLISIVTAGDIEGWRKNLEKNGKFVIMGKIHRYKKSKIKELIGDCNIVEK